MRRVAASTLGRQSAVALYSHVALGTIGLCARDPAAPLSVTALGVALVASVLPRLVVAHLLAAFRAREPARWARLYGGSALVSSGGVCVGATLLIAAGDLGSAPFALLLALAGVGAAGLALFVGDAEFLRFSALSARLVPASVGAASAAPPTAAAPAPVAADESVSRVSSARAPLPGGKVLLVEDTPANQLLVTSYLRKMGATVTLAENGKIALDTVRAALREGHPFDVILMDMQMPVLDGYEATRALRSEGYGGPIVAVTAHAMAGDREKCLAAGCDEYLSKPIDRGSFTSTVERFVAHGRAPIAIDDPVAGSLPVERATPSMDGPLVSELASDPDMQEILPAFLQALGGRAAALQAAVGERDDAALKRLAHQLKGVAGGYGFPSITAQAKVVEGALSSPDEGSLVGAVETLVRLCLRARDGGGPSSARA